MEHLNYQLIVDRKSENAEQVTKQHVDLVVKEVKEVLDLGELQVKIKELPNTQFTVSMAAQLADDTVVLRKRGKRLLPLVKKLKKSLMRRLRGRASKHRKRRISHRRRYAMGA
jgi:hypothetical protein